MSAFSNSKYSTAEQEAFIDLLITWLVQTVRPIVAFVVVSAALGAMLLPLIWALFHFSTPESRKTPLFIAVILSVFLGILQSITTMTVFLQPLFRPTDVIPKSLLVFQGLCVHFPTFAVDCVLFIRILAVYPPLPNHKVRTGVVFGPPILFKLVRIVAMMEQALATADDIKSYYSASAERATPELRVWGIVLWLFAALDNMYATGAFLMKLNTSIDFFKRSSRANKPTSVVDKLRRLFWVSVTNFVFPVPIFVALVILSAIDPDSLVYHMIANVQSYVVLICAVFATVWSSSHAQKERIIEEFEASKSFSSGPRASAVRPVHKSNNSLTAPMLSAPLLSSPGPFMVEMNSRPGTPRHSVVDHRV